MTASGGLKPAVSEHGAFRCDRLGILGDFLHRFLQHFLRDASTLERIREAAGRVLIELSFVAPQPFANVAFQQRLIGRESAHRRDGFQRLHDIGGDAHRDRGAGSNFLQPFLQSFIDHRSNLLAIDPRAEANHGVSPLLVSARVLQHKEGVIEDGRGFFEGDAVPALTLRGLRLVPAEARASVLKDAVHALSLSARIYSVNTVYRMRGRPPLRPFLRAAAVLAAEVRRPPARPSSASHAVPGNMEETRPGTLRSTSSLSQWRPPPRPRTSTARMSSDLASLRLGISLTGNVMDAPFVSSIRNACF